MGGGGATLWLQWKFVTKIFWGSFRAEKFLTHLRSLILRRIFLFEFRQKKILIRIHRVRIWIQHFRLQIQSGSRILWKKFTAEKGTDAYPEHMNQKLMRALSSEHTRQDLMYALIVDRKFEKVPSKNAEHACRNWFVHWAYVSGTDSFAEHTYQELIHLLSIRVRNWFICWAYVSGTDSFAEHTCQELIRMLSIRIRN